MCAFILRRDLGVRSVIGLGSFPDSSGTIYHTSLDKRQSHSSSALIGKNIPYRQKPLLTLCKCPHFSRVKQELLDSLFVCQCKTDLKLPFLHYFLNNLLSQ